MPALRIAIALAIAVLAARSAQASQTCDTSHYPLSAPTARFRDNHDGSVTDTRNTMTWMRCAVGQKWNGTGCDGTPTPLSWQAAQDEASAIDRQGGFAGQTDWRVPRIVDLAMIVERQCADPRINLTVFPATPADIFWTASSRRGRGNEDQAYYLSFGAEGTGAAPKMQAHFVRLLRLPPK